MDHQEIIPDKIDRQPTDRSIFLSILLPLYSIINWADPSATGCKMYKFLFGPVPSRRLGMSLGVDLVPKKVCSLDCVYCEVGKTTKLTTRRMAYVPFDKVTEELDHYFNHHPDPDYFTFSGSGEPTLNIHLGEVIRHIRKNKPGIPVAVLTNGTLLNDPEVRDELMLADVVLPSLDAATREGFDRINRPADGIGIGEYINGLVAFREAFAGEIWLEVFILPGYNDNPLELENLLTAIRRIRPDSVQLNTLDRPGTVEGLTSASEEQLRKIAAEWNLDNLEIIAKPENRKHEKAYRDDIESVILDTILRRPCTVDDLSDILGLHVSEINKYLDVLERQGKIYTVREARGIFYRANF